MCFDVAIFMDRSGGPKVPQKFSAISAVDAMDGWSLPHVEMGPKHGEVPTVPTRKKPRKIPGDVLGYLGQFDSKKMAM